MCFDLKKWILCLLLACVNLAHSKTYYISNKGSSNNDGLSPGKALNTIGRLVPGNTYLLNKGEVFYFNLDCSKSRGDGNLKKIVISSYGSGEKPVISTYKNLKNNKWKSYSKNIWKINILDTTSFSGFNKIANTNVGHIRVDKQILGNKCANLNALKKENDFFSDDLDLYIFLEKSPVLSRSMFQVACDVTIIQLTDNMEISDVILTGTGGHAINGNNKNNVYLHDLEINTIGGSYLVHGKNLRYGNGIQFWNGASNCVVRNCKISEVYDAAITLQGRGNNLIFKNIQIYDNYIYNNEQSFEFWIKGENGTFDSCSFSKNNCENAGMGWSHNVRPDKVGVHILSYSGSAKDSDLFINDNIFNRAATGYMYYSGNNVPLFKAFDNKVTLDDSIPIWVQHSNIKLKDVDVFLNLTNSERGSFFMKRNYKN
jgi:hypothetical protein